MMGIQAAPGRARASRKLDKSDSVSNQWLRYCLSRVWPQHQIQLDSKGDMGSA